MAASAPSLRIATFATMLALTFLVSACVPASQAPGPADPAAPSGQSPAPSQGSASDDVEVITEGLTAPWSIAFVGESALVSERDSGRILELLPDGGTREVAVVAGVKHGGEGGLLGIAVDGDELYAYFTTPQDNRVARFPLSGSPGSYALGDPEVILEGIPAAGIHNGGRIKFGPDGMLYVTAGDAADKPSAQDPDSLSGKILRVTPDGDIPADNPFPGSPVWTLGHRNPQGIAWDSAGTMYASEFGQNTWDELNIIEAGSNYGWPEVEGIAGREGFVDPVQVWSPQDASPSGIAIANDSIFIVNLRGQRLRVVPLAETDTADEYFVAEYGRLRDVVAAPDGSVWILTNNTDGRGVPYSGDDRILRIVP